MVYGLIRSIQAALKYRGGWKGLMEHMYTVSRCLIMLGRVYRVDRLVWHKVKVHALALAADADVSLMHERSASGLDTSLRR